VVNIATAIEASQAQVLLQEMLGVLDPEVPRGLELLLRQDEVSIVVLPELDARIEVREPRFLTGVSPCPGKFRDCAKIAEPIPPPQQPPESTTLGRLFDDVQVLSVQRYLLERLRRQHWRWFAILSPPEGKDESQAIEWRNDLTRGMGEDCDHGALYWPWVLAQDRPGAPVVARSPVGFVAGVFARRDLARGPHIAPANETLRAVVGLERSIDDAINGAVYDAGVNVIRPFPGYGIQLWGARTLLWRDRDSRTNPLAFVNGRRSLSAIERMAERIGQQSVFEPHSALLRVQVSQAIAEYLLRVFDSGALAGQTAEQSFFVRCDHTNNPPESVEQGRLICEVGVALAAPAEFIVFRVGRAEGVTEIEEAA
jgi:phage tail sheath protein FI